MLTDENLIFIEDQNSRYGTMVNGERIKKVQLFPGDEVQIGFCRIDWEGRSGFQPSLNEIEVIPNLSVPVKRPNQHSSALTNMHSNNILNNVSNGLASKELANSLIETEAQMDRIEYSISQIESVEKSQTINEATIPSEDSFKEMTITTQSELASEELKVSGSNHDTESISNNSDHLSILESINYEGDLKKDSYIEDVSSDNNLTIELHQEIIEVVIHISTDIQSKEEPIVSNISEESNSISPQIPLVNTNPIIEQELELNYPISSISGQGKNNWIRKDSLQIALIIVFTCLLLIAGWLIGQAS